MEQQAAKSFRIALPNYAFLLLYSLVLLALPTPGGLQAQVSEEDDAYAMQAAPARHQLLFSDDGVLQRMPAEVMKGGDLIRFEVQPGPELAKGLEQLARRVAASHYARSVVGAPGLKFPGEQPEPDSLERQLQQEMAAWLAEYRELCSPMCSLSLLSPFELEARKNEGGSYRYLPHPHNILAQVYQMAIQYEYQGKMKQDTLQLEWREAEELFLAYARLPREATYFRYSLLRIHPTAVALRITRSRLQQQVLYSNSQYRLGAETAWLEPKLQHSLRHLRQLLETGSLHQKVPVQGLEQLVDLANPVVLRYPDLDRLYTADVTEHEGEWARHWAWYAGGESVANPASLPPPAQPGEEGPYRVHLYEGVLYLTNGRPRRWMRHYDLHRLGHGRLTGHERHAYDKRDQVFVLAHNVAPSQELAIAPLEGHALQPVPARLPAPQPTVAKPLPPRMLGYPAGLAPQLAAWLKGPEAREPYRGQQALVFTPELRQDLQHLEALLSNYRKRLQRLQQAPESLYHPGQVSLEGGPQAPSPRFRTVAFNTKAPRLAEGNHTEFSLQLMGQEPRTLTSDRFRSYRLNRFQLAVGLAYSFPSYQAYTVQDGAFSLTNRDGLIPFFGLKIYPGGTNPWDTRFLFSRPLRQTFSLLLGASITAPTRDWVTGVGLDLWSGVTLQGGVHIMRLDDPTVEFGQVVANGSRYDTRGFVGLSIDPILLVRLFDFAR